MAFIINKYTNYCYKHVQTYVQEMHYFPSFISIENESLYSDCSIQENVILIYSIYSINNLET